MKKISIVIVAFLGFVFTSFAQQNPKKTIKKTEKIAKVVKKEGKAVVTKTVETKVVLKKDGTPDKRYKNTTVKKVVLKKDGTPDKRYKNE
jgi:hypothetical protein